MLNFLIFKFQVRSCKWSQYWYLSFSLFLWWITSTLRHKFLKSKQRYDLQNKMSWHSDFKSFTDKLFPLSLRWIRRKIPDYENEAKQNRYEFPSTSSVIKYLLHFEKVAGFHRSFCLFISKSLHFYANPSPNYLLSYCSMVWWWLQMKGLLLANVSKKR